MKAQSAMEYLMTYGWAILIIAVVLAALFQLGVFNSSSFSPRAPPGACQVIRPSGPGTTTNINIMGVCTGQLPQFVSVFNTQNFINFGNIMGFGATNSFTATAWLYPTPKTGYNRYYAVAKSYSDSGHPTTPGWDVGFYADHVFFSIDDGTIVYRVGNDGSAISYSKWYFATLRVNRTSQQANAYLNNVQIGSTISTATLGSLAGTSAFTIGQGSYQNGYGAFSGSIANVQIYNTSLSSNEVQALYLEGIGGAPILPQYLFGWWPLNGNANDYSGNNNNGAPAGVTFTSQYGK